jgi:hypothetical protein
MSIFVGYKMAITIHETKKLSGFQTIYTRDNSKTKQNCLGHQLAVTI